MILTGSAAAEKGRAAAVVLGRWPAKSGAAVGQIIQRVGKR